MIPNQKTEKYIDLPASDTEILSLCRFGLLPVRLYFRAVSLMRKNGQWMRFFRIFLQFFAVTAFCGAAFFFMLYFWNSFFTWYGIVSFSVLLPVCAFTALRPSYMGLAAGYAGEAVIGFLVFWPNVKFNAGLEIWEQFFIWTALVFLWVIPLKQVSVKLSFLYFFNISFYLFAVQKILPAGISGYFGFLIVMSLANSVFLLLKEFMAGYFKTPVLHALSVRLSLLFFIFLPLFFTFTDRSVFEGKIFASFFAFLFFWGMFYCFYRPDAVVQKISMFLALVWIYGGLYRLAFCGLFPSRAGWAFLFVSSFLCTAGVLSLGDIVFSYICKRRTS